LINNSHRWWDNIFGFVCFAACLDRWIPASAGMTAWWMKGLIRKQKASRRYEALFLAGPCSLQD
jgi:hypothetical protein